MKKSEVLRMLLLAAEALGEVIRVGYYDNWVSVEVKQNDGAECSLTYQINKEVKKDA